MCDAVAMLEDDPRFNAGTGSNLRFDGQTIEMDAACMDSSGRFGAVACIRDVKNPVHVARAIMRTPHNLLVGKGATAYARSIGYGPHNPWTENAQAKFDLLRQGLRASNYDPADCAWDLRELARNWNYDIPLKDILGPEDTVGAIASDGTRYAAALSTGGTMSTLLGRVGDVPLPGCGLFAGPLGAVAGTGHGDELTRKMLAHTAYGWLASGLTPEQVMQKAFGLFADDVDVGLLILKGDEWAAGSNRDMAWACAREEA